MIAHPPTRLPMMMRAHAMMAVAFIISQTSAVTEKSELSTRSRDVESSLPPSLYGGMHSVHVCYSALYIIYVDWTAYFRVIFKMDIKASTQRVSNSCGFQILID